MSSSSTAATDGAGAGPGAGAGAGGLARVDCSDVSGFTQSMLHNSPVLVTCSPSHWPLCELFHSKGNFSMEEFSKLHGEQEVLVNMGGESEGGGCAEQRCMSIREFVSRIEQGEALYAKDWHFFQFPDMDLTYEVPDVFADDWLNVYWQRVRGGVDDYRFLYIGGPGTSTNVHHDVLYSYSWSLNLHGKKRWTLWPPEESHLLRATSGRGVGEVVKDARVGCYDTAVFPGLSHASPITVVQGEGEALFVPAGWYHMVENLDNNICCNNDSNIERMSQGNQACRDETFTTVSVNHNWINGFNIYEAWNFLIREMNSIRSEMWEFLDSNEIEKFSTSGHEMHRLNDLTFSQSREGVGMDSAEWARHCELTLRVNAGLGCKEFLEMVISRVVCLCSIHLATNNDPQTLFSEELSVDNFFPFVTKPVIAQSQDIKVYHNLSVTPVSTPCRRNQYTPHVDIAMTSHSQNSQHMLDIVSVTSESLTEILLGTYGIKLCNSTSSFEFCMLEIFKLILEIRNSSQLLKYLSHV
jgi:hypothetical protein